MLKKKKFSPRSADSITQTPVITIFEHMVLMSYCPLPCVPDEVPWTPGEPTSISQAAGPTTSSSAQVHSVCLSPTTV